MSMKYMFISIATLMMMLVLVSIILIEEKPGNLANKSVAFVQNTFDFYKNHKVGNVEIIRPKNWVMYSVKEKGELLKYGFIPIEFRSSLGSEINIFDSSLYYVKYKRTEIKSNKEILFIVANDERIKKLNGLVKKHSIKSSSFTGGCLAGATTLKMHDYFKAWEGHSKGAKLFYFPRYSLIILSYDKMHCDFILKPEAA